MIKHLNKTIAMLSALLFAGTMMAQNNVWTAQNAVGKDSTDVAGVFKTYARPADYPYMEGDPTFNVTVNGSPVGLYNDKNFWNGMVSFGSFDFAEGQTVTVIITAKEPMKTFEVLPQSAAVKNVKRLSPNAIQLTVTRPNQNITLVPNGDYKGDVLHLFCNSIDTNAPKAPQLTNGYGYDPVRKLQYFASGYHHLADIMKDGTLAVEGDAQIYIAGGAVVDGQLRIHRGKGAKLYGRGMAVNAVTQIVTSVDGCDSARVEGVLIHGHRSQCWCTTLGSSRNVAFDNVKIVTTRYASTDGLDVIGSSNCTFDNLFIRSCDDAIAIKGLAPEDKAPADCPPDSNLVFRRIQLWNDCNNAFGMGAETRARNYSDISLIDSDILFSYDDPHHHEQLDERAALNICSLQGTFFKRILFDNVRVNRCERLISIGFKKDFWFGSLQGKHHYPGGIDGVTFRNVTSNNNSGSRIANEVLLYGWDKEGDPRKEVTNITFDHVTIEGKPFDSKDNTHLKLGPAVRTVTFK